MPTYKSVFDKAANADKQTQRSTGKSCSSSLFRAKAYVEAKAFPQPSPRKARVIKSSCKPLVIGGKICNL